MTQIIKHSFLNLLVITTFVVVSGFQTHSTRWVPTDQCLNCVVLICFLLNRPPFIKARAQSSRQGADIFTSPLHLCKTTRLALNKCLSVSQWMTNKVVHKLYIHKNTLLASTSAIWLPRHVVCPGVQTSIALECFGIPFKDIWHSADNLDIIETPAKATMAALLSVDMHNSFDTR